MVLSKGTRVLNCAAYYKNPYEDEGPEPEVITIPFKPHPDQASIFQALRRFSVLVCHRRFGKTVLSVNRLIRKALEADPIATPRWRGAYIAPLFKQAKTVAWDYMKHYTHVVPGRKVNESELRIDFPNESRISLLGTDNPDSIRGVYLDGVVLDEVAQMAGRVWGEIIRPTLADRKGWCIFIGTPQGHNLFYDMWKRACATESWCAMMFKASETQILDYDELQAARGEMAPDEYEQEFECSFSAAVKGAYYGELIGEAERAGRIGRVPIDPALDMHTAWDIGVKDSTAIWFFQVGPMGDVRFVRYYEDSGEGAQEYVRVLREYAKKERFVYGRHYAPHDIAVREWGSNARSRYQIVRKLGFKLESVDKIAPIDGINAARVLLSRCYFDFEGCNTGLEALRHYRKEFNDKLNIFKDHPLHDWSSHGADAFRTFAVAYRDPIAYHNRVRNLAPKAISEYDELAL